MISCPTLMQGSLSLPQRLSLQSSKSFTTRSVGLVTVCRRESLNVSRLDDIDRRYLVADSKFVVPIAGPVQELPIGGRGGWLGFSSTGSRSSGRMRACSFATLPCCSVATAPTYSRSDHSILAHLEISTWKKAVCGVSRPFPRDSGLQWLPLQCQRGYRRNFSGQVAVKDGGQDVPFKDVRAGYQSGSDSGASVVNPFNEGNGEKQEGKQRELKETKPLVGHEEEPCSQVEVEKEILTRGNVKVVEKNKYDSDGENYIETFEEKDRKKKSKEAEKERKKQVEAAKKEITVRGSDSEGDEKDMKKQAKAAKKEMKEMKIAKKREKGYHNDNEGDDKKVMLTMSEKQEEDSDSDSGSESGSESEDDYKKMKKKAKKMKLKAEKYHEDESVTRGETECVSDSEYEGEDDGVRDMDSEIMEEDEEDVELAEDEEFSDEIENELAEDIEDEFEDEDGFDEEFWDEEEDEAEIGDGGDGGGVVLGGTYWGKKALDLAEEMVASFGSDLSLFAFKVSPDGLIRVRLDKLSNQYGSPTMADIERFSRDYNQVLSEASEAGTIPSTVAVEVSSPGAERIIRIPEDLERFKQLPMYVEYLESEVGNEGEPNKKDGVLELESLDSEAGMSVWKLANVKVNREVQGKGRPLNSKQRKWRAHVPLTSLKLVRLYLDV